MLFIISYITHWNGALLINNSVDFWYWQISLRATVPGLNLLFFFSCCDDGFHGAFCSNIFWCFSCSTSCSISSFSCSTFHSGHLRCWLGQDVLKKWPLFVFFLILRCLSSQKSWPSFVLVCSQLMYWLLIRPHSLLVSRLCLQGCLVYDCNHHNTQVYIQTQNIR